MNYETAKQYLLSKPEAREDYPFGPDVMVPKIKAKMFATLGVNDNIAQMNLKCDPNQANELRDLFEAVKPGYHMNKLHWNTIILDGSIPVGEIERMIDHSYKLVVKKLRKAERQALELSYGKEALYKD
ncbi:MULTISPECIES: MmcQ/YjbR family DNA-binding protein [unclassified Oleiphilus]|uniref:MmcQ/YjbR family DNA-binding protein n=2 Tax=Oleiphilus TaxID=141450 RepID=UPI0007C2BA1B